MLNLKSPTFGMFFCFGMILLVYCPDIMAQQAHLNVQVIDSQTDELTPVRVRFTEVNGKIPPAPKEAVAIMYGRWDRAEGYEFQPDSSFYVDGGFNMELPGGEYKLQLSKGNEYISENHQIKLQPGDSLSMTFPLNRWINTPERGWYSADDHIHIRRSPRKDPLISVWTAAEDIYVGVMLWMGDFWETFYSQYAFGEEGVYKRGNRILASGQEEPRTPELGHTIGIGAEEPVRFRDQYYYYDLVFDRIRELGGLTGYVHQAATFHGYRGLTLDGLRGRLDMLEILQFCAIEGPLVIDYYYHMLELGYKMTAIAGSDFPWCGRGERYGVEDAPDWPTQIGDVRFYTYTGDEFSYPKWKDALAAGHTFVSSGPVLDFSINEFIPGDELDIQAGSTLRISARAFGHADQVPLDNLQIIAHGEIIYQVYADDEGQSVDELKIDFELNPERGMWIAAKTEAGLHQVAHTTPIYVRVDGGGFHNPETANKYLDLSEKYLQALEYDLENPGDRLDHQAWRYKDGLMKRIEETRDVIKILREKLK